MANDIQMPALSPTMEEGTLAKWLVAVGDNVSSGDILAEIETDKAIMEFETIDDGVIGALLVDEGQEGIKVGTVIATLLGEGEEAGESAPKAEVKATPEPTPESIPEPKESHTKDSNTPPAPPVKTPPAKASSQKDGERIFASPLARRIAADSGIDLATITGTGPNGRIVKADVASANVPASAGGKAPAPTESALAKPATALPPSESREAVKALYQSREFEEIALSNMRKIIATRLTEAKQSIPHFYLRRRARIDKLLALRSEMNAGLDARGIKLSVNDFIIKASACALKSVPRANVAWAGDCLLQFTAADIAIAVAIDDGLLTPVIEDCDTKGLSVISAQMKDLAGRARDKKLAPQEYQGGSFSISNLGMMGVEEFDAVINPPHGAILAVGAGQKTPVIGAKGGVETATMLGLTLSVDHRAIDGALGAELLGAIVGYLEEPLSMLA